MPPRLTNYDAAGLQRRGLPRANGTRRPEDDRKKRERPAESTHHVRSAGHRCVSTQARAFVEGVEAARLGSAPAASQTE
jgi:hypothetical protein